MQHCQKRRDIYLSAAKQDCCYILRFIVLIIGRKELSGGCKAVLVLHSSFPYSPWQVSMNSGAWLKMRNKKTIIKSIIILNLESLMGLAAHVDQEAGDRYVTPIMNDSWNIPTQVTGRFSTSMDPDRGRDECAHLKALHNEIYLPHTFGKLNVHRVNNLLHSHIQSAQKSRNLVHNI